MQTDDASLMLEFRKNLSLLQEISSCGILKRQYTSATLDRPKAWSRGPFPFNAGVAQLVEQLICNQLVGGSSPFAGSLIVGTWLVGRDSGGRLPEWLKGTDCKSVGLRLRRFESYTSHYLRV